MRPVLLFILGSIPVFAQPFSAGLKAGIPLSDFLTATDNGLFQYNAPTQRYIIGGMAELRLPLVSAWSSTRFTVTWNSAVRGWWVPSARSALRGAIGNFLYF